MKDVILGILFFLAPSIIFSQNSISLGIKTNPVFNHVIANKGSELDKTTLRIIRGFTPLYGANIVFYRKGELGIEAGINRVYKRHGIFYYFDNEFTDNARGGFITTSTEIPFSISYKIYENFILNYKLFLLSGFSFNRHRYYRDFSGTRLNYKYSIVHEVSEADFGYKSYSNSIFTGFKINAIIKNFGMVEYGLSYHYDFKQMPPFEIFGTVNVFTPFQAKLVPRLNYININLTYYFLSIQFDKGIKRVRNKISKK